MKKGQSENEQLNSKSISENLTASITKQASQSNVELQKKFAQVINVKIENTQILEETTGKYVVYNIKITDATGEYEILRRYGDFYVLRQYLISRWPGCFVAPIPNKQIVGNLDVKFIELRKTQLEVFLLELKKSPQLWYGDESHMFFHTPPNFNLEQLYKQLPQQSVDQITQKFEKNFENLGGAIMNLKLVNEIQEFQRFIRFIRPMLGNFQVIYQNFFTAEDNYNEQYLSLLTNLLPNYEQNHLVGFEEDKQIFSQESEKLKPIFEKLKTSFKRNEDENLLTAVKQEQLEIEAFNESFDQREKYESLRDQAKQQLINLKLKVQEIISGRVVISVILTSTCLEKKEQIALLQTKIIIQQKVIDELTLLCDIITVIMGSIQMKSFKKSKLQTYYRMIKSIAQFEKNAATIRAEYWTVISSNKNLKNKSDQKNEVAAPKTDAQAKKSAKKVEKK